MKTISIPLRILVDVRHAIKALPSLYGCNSIPTERVDDFYKAVGAFGYYVDALVREVGEVAVDAVGE